MLNKKTKVKTILWQQGLKKNCQGRIPVNVQITHQTEGRCEWHKWELWQKGTVLKYVYSISHNLLFVLCTIHSLSVCDETSAKEELTQRWCAEHWALNVLQYKQNGRERGNSAHCVYFHIHRHKTMSLIIGCFYLKHERPKDSFGGFSLFAVWQGFSLWICIIW